MLRTKICGVCSAHDARAAESAGADYIGVILAPGQRRTRTAAEADAIFAAVGVQRVGVFVDPSLETARAAALRFDLHAIQLHGAESVDFVHGLRAAVRDAARPPLVWKAVRVRSPEEAVRELDAWSDVADAIVLDGWSADAHGGSGARFDWSAVASRLTPRSRTCDLIVAGGLTPGNVARAVALLRPDAVDVSSGVEDAPGRKSADRMRAFIAAARQHDAAPQTRDRA